MDLEFHAFSAILSVIWFLAYWILGGVFFALLAVLRLGRVRKVRFSCLFTLFSVACAAAAGWGGMWLARDQVHVCLESAANRAEAVTAIFGCGFVGIFGLFLLGALALVLGGVIIMQLSETRTRPWIVLEQEGGDEAIAEGIEAPSDDEGYFE